MSDLTLICKCGDTFETKAALSSHENYCEKSEKHVKEKYTCVCDESFKDSAAYNTHRNFCDESEQKPDYDLSREKVECPDCGSMVADTQLENHRKSKTCENGGTLKSLKLNKKSGGYSDYANKTGLTFRDFKNVDDGYKCFEYGKVCRKLGIVNHYWRKHANEGQQHSDDLSFPGNPTRFETNDFEGKCKHCGKQFENPQSLGGHVVLCERNPKRNKTRKKISETQKGKTFSEKRKRKISKYMKKAVKENPESYAGTNILSNRKTPEYQKENGKVIKFDSGWELEVAQWLEEKNINWIYDAGRLVHVERFSTFLLSRFLFAKKRSLL